MYLEKKGIQEIIEGVEIFWTVSDLYGNNLV